MGLTSRAGIVPLYLDRDIGGPIARTVADAVAVLNVIAGYDPADPVTAAAQTHRAPDYNDYLVADGLRGARIGVLRQLSNTPTADSEVVRRFDEALDDMRKAGAVVVDSVEIPELDSIKGPLFCPRFKWDLNAYLAHLGPDAPVKSLADVIASHRFHPSIELRLQRMEDVPGTGPDDNAECREAAANAATLRAGVRHVLAAQRLEALVYPSWDNPPRLIGDLNTPHGNNSPRISPPTGFPAMTVPMGFVRDSLPVGLQILGDAWSEPTLIKIAYGYEQTRHHRRPPSNTPPLR
jgi:amidase